MAVRRSGEGQPERTLALLWRNYRRPGTTADPAAEAQNLREQRQTDATGETARPTNHGQTGHQQTDAAGPQADQGQPAAPARPTERAHAARPSRPTDEEQAADQPVTTRRRSAGRRPSLEVDDVVLAAIKLADLEGLTAASMGGVAKKLGVGTMTLYTYVPSKEELLDLMVDQVLGERALPGPDEPRPDDWREQIEVYSRETRAMFQRHPWLCQVSTIRPPVGPGMLAGREYLLSALLPLGLSPTETNTAALAITTYVDSAVGLEAESELVERSTGQTNDAWWYERNDLWETYFDVERHPAMTAIWNANGYQSSTREAAADSYRYGLDRLLDGIQAMKPL